MATRGTQKDPSWDRPSAADQRRLRAEARADDRVLADVYEQGIRDGKRDARSSSRSSR